MEDWIILDDKTKTDTNDEIITVNNFITKLDNEIESRTYEKNSFNSNFVDNITPENKFFSSCSLLINNFYLQIKTLQFYLLTMINDLKQNLY